MEGGTQCWMGTREGLGEAVVAGVFLRARGSGRSEDTLFYQA